MRIALHAQSTPGPGWRSGFSRLGGWPSHSFRPDATQFQAPRGWWLGYIGNASSRHPREDAVPCEAFSTAGKISPRFPCPSMPPNTLSFAIWAPNTGFCHGSMAFYAG